MAVAISDNKPGHGRVYCLQCCSIGRDDEAAVLDLDPDALSGFESGVFKPHAGDAQPGEERRRSPVSAGFR